ncbi:WAP four-disulfide core domain protein 2-like [Physella acuta]|uniref:WAP four-disulfide core domain protein 2-like n=1 Tax=Physella acuta TaxID=109671 RepID=UPI0027DC9646|nr:WAP four-disulfide core domain protein 2-like [Physella acuta]XP_059144058.1 WAP four-disulfide core domain protein 2-like [Physella acuta]
MRDGMIYPTSSLYLVWCGLCLFIQLGEAAKYIKHSNKCVPKCKGVHICVELQPFCSYNCKPSITCMDPWYTRFYDLGPLPTTTPIKPGCPTVSPGGSCAKHCNSDTDCSPGNLCCQLGCRTTCTPDRRLPTKEKLGFCPLALSRSLEVCDYQCYQDVDCPGSQKCCSSKCGSRCTAPCYLWLNSQGQWEEPAECRR